MKLVEHHGAPAIAWDKQTGFSSGLAAGSPEHGGAHERLLELAIEIEFDFEPYGRRYRDDADCSSGCRHFAILDGPLGADWGVCMNRRSPRAGLLTFELQGCPGF
jgi:hypothetical protein